jgi:putative endonuclease
LPRQLGGQARTRSRPIGGYPSRTKKDSMNFYYVYILFSHKDKKLYVGFTSDLKDRIEKHNSGGNDSTKNRRPLSLVHYEAYLSEKDARAREKYFKTGFGRESIKKQLKNTLEQFKNLI